MSYVVYLIKFLDCHNGTVAALATVAIAVFTILLWRSTHKMWGATKQAAEAAQKSADALYATEGPYIHTDAHLKSVNRDGDVVTLETDFSVGNYGRTPAIHNLIEMLHNFEPTIPPGPHQDVFTRSWSTGIINKDKSLKDTTPIFVKGEDWNGVETREPTKRLFLLIRVDYQDVFGNGDVKDFWWVYKPIDCVWSIYKGAKSA